MKRKNKIDGISIQSFVEHYLGTRHNCYMLKHQGLKSFDNPYLIGVSNDFAIKNFDYVGKNELVVVIDDFGNPGTYVNPLNIKKLMELEVCKEKIKLLNNISCRNFDEAAILYQMCSQLISDIECLEGLYGGTYELLRLVNKNKLIRSIRKQAKEEAKRTLIFTRINESNISTEQVWETDYQELDTSVEENALLPDDSLEDYKVTDKVNRQRKLSYKLS